MSASNSLLERDIVCAGVRFVERDREREQMLMMPKDGRDIL